MDVLRRDLAKGFLAFFPDRSVETIQVTVWVALDLRHTTFQKSSKGLAPLPCPASFHSANPAGGSIVYIGFKMYENNWSSEVALYQRVPDKGLSRNKMGLLLRG